MSQPINPSIRPTQTKSPRVATKFSWSDPDQRNPAILLGILCLALVIAYWNMFSLTSAAWANPLYSHGYLLPAFALGIFWLRRQPFQWTPPSERWIGVGILVGALLIRIFAAIFDMAPVDRLSFIVAMFGIFLLVGGLQCVRWAWPGICFLVFMFPLPSVLENSLLMHLQRVATVCSTLILQTLGIAAYRAGNVITLPGVVENLTVAEECSGLRMLTIFGAMSVAMIFLIDRPWWDKFIVLLSAIPIAVLSNVVRIVLTALLYLLTTDEHARQLAHDVSGLLMMVWGLGFLWIEFQILSRVTIPEEVSHVKLATTKRQAPIPIR